MSYLYAGLGALWVVLFIVWEVLAYRRDRRDFEERLKRLRQDMDREAKPVPRVYGTAPKPHLPWRGPTE